MGEHGGPDGVRRGTAGRQGVKLDGPVSPGDNVDAEDAALFSPDGLLDRTGNGADELNLGVLLVREQDVSGLHLSAGLGGHARDEPVEVGGMQGEPVGCGNGMGLAMGAALEADVQTFPDLDGCRHVQMYVRDLRRKCRGWKPIGTQTGVRLASPCPHLPVQSPHGDIFVA